VEAIEPGLGRIRLFYVRIDGNSFETAFLCQAGRCPRPRRSKVPTRWAQTACAPLKEDLGRWSPQR
jgi:hypothetical protein